MATSFSGYHQPILSGAPDLVKSIKYDRLSRDFALYINGEIKGYTTTYQAGEEKLNELVYALLGGKEEAV